MTLSELATTSNPSISYLEGTLSIIHLKFKKFFLSFDGLSQHLCGPDITNTQGIEANGSSIPLPMVSKSPRNTTLFNEPNDNRRNLVIVLSAVFGSLALFMVVSATVFVIRWKRNPKYHRRGISPVDDEEIERWRGRKETYTEAPGRSPPKSHKRQSSSVVIVSNPPGWTWSAEPSPFGTRTSGETALSPPPMVARAPNSRSGLTDGAILGADPFVPPVRRPSTKLAKHSRNQSRKSSFSASIPERMSTDYQRHYRDDSKKSFQADRVSPPSSIFNGSPGGNEPLPSFARPAYGRVSSRQSANQI